MPESEHFTYYVHKHEVSQQYGGPEEGGWYYEIGTPAEGWCVEGFSNEDAAYARCRELNVQESKRRTAEEKYDYTSVLSHLSEHYAYDVAETSLPYHYPENRPYYE